MKSTWPPPQVILVGLEPNQHGHAASHEHASSSWPVIFHGVLSLASFVAARRGAPRKRSAATSAQGKKDMVFMVQNFMIKGVLDKPILWCGRAVIGIVWKTPMRRSFTSQRAARAKQR